MLRVRTFFLGTGIRFSPDPINVPYGVAATITLTEYGSAVGYDTMATSGGHNYYTLEGMKAMLKKFRNKGCNKCKIENKVKAKPLSLLDKVKLFFKKK